jgi:putative sigma-54 modulation protein
MRLELTGRHVDVTAAVKRLVSDKLSKLERVLNHRALSAQAVLSREKNQCRVDITLHARGERFLHGVGAGPTWEPAVTASIDKIGQQAKKLKGKWEARKRRDRGARVAIDQAEPTAVAPEAIAVRTRTRMPRILRAERAPIRSMSIADAARVVDSTGVPVIFRESETAAISVLYKHDGELTLVETEA